MKSLARLLNIHVFISIFLFFAIISGADTHTDLLLLLLFLPAINKGLQKIQSNPIPVSTQPSTFSSYPFHNF